jgi:D-alanyl-D-alanine carboxypeptidase (penicillin-binding protein 5/6)
MFCLASFASYNGLDLICVILHSDSSDIRFNETKSLFDFGFKNFAFKDIAKKGTDETKTLKLVLSDSVNTLVDSSEVTDNYSPQITLKDIPSAPIAKGKVLGTATYIVNDKSYVVNLIASNDVTLSTSRIIYKFAY